MSNFSGVMSNEDLAPNIIKQPGALPKKVRKAKFYKDAGAFISLMMVIPCAVFIHVYEIFFLVGLFFYFAGKKNAIQYKLETPVFEGGKGLILLGKEKEEGTNIYASDSLCRQHLLVMGSTGSGKTRFLMSILYQSMVVGSGCMYVDGKADNTVYWLVFSVCQRLDRLDDFVVINYLTTESTLLKDKNASIRRNDEILTNTMNPYSSGSSEGLRSMTVGLMRDSGGDGDMWKGRASSLLSGTMRFLTHLREVELIQMSVMSIRDSMPLDTVLRIVLGEFNGSSKIMIGDNVVDLKETKVPDYAIRPLRKYLADLPGYSEQNAINDDEVDSECYKQHGFLTMQLTEALSDLSETYGHIFNAPIGEVDFTDLIQSRRILFVMLPALQRDPDALSNLGKMIISSIRSALGPALGSQVEGYKETVIDQKATNAKEPFFIILDEYGYYSVKGFAIVAAQARSLGVSVVFAGQDYAGFKKGSADEAESVVANTNIKIAMKLEEKTTVELFVDRADKGMTPIRKGLEKKEGMFGNKVYRERDDISYEKVSIIEPKDLYGQEAGEAHIIIGNKVYRVNLFSLLLVGEGNGTTKEAPFARLNRFLMIRPPNSNYAKEVKEKRQKLYNTIHDKDSADSKDVRKNVKRDPNINAIFKAFRQQYENKRGVFDSSIAAIGYICLEQSEKDEIEAKNQAQNPQKPSAKTVEEHSSSIEAKKEKETKDYVGLNNENGYKEESLSSKAEETTSFFEGIMNSVMTANGEKPIRDQLVEVGEDILGDKEEAISDAERSIKLLEDKFKYPTPPKPKKPSSSAVKEKLNSLASKISTVEVREEEKESEDASEDEDASDIFHDMDSFEDDL